MQFQKPSKDSWVFLEGLECTTLEAGPSIECEHQSSHKKRPQGKAAVLVLVAGQISRAQAIRQHHRLAKGEAESFACNGIDRAGCISNESNISAADTLQLASGGEGAFFGRRNVSPVQPGLQFGEL